jgi:hypothetical protein
MNRNVFHTSMDRLRKVWWQWLLLRQALMGYLLTNLYGTPMRVLPAGHVGIAGAIVLWLVQNGGRQLVMVRQPAAKDNRARLVSCMGVGRHGDMASALRAAVTAQLGEVFARSLKLEKIANDRVAAAPMYTYTDEANGIVTPVQVLAWVLPLQPVQLELIKLAPGFELVMVQEAQLLAGRTTGIAPTHLAIWRSVQRHLPQRALPVQDDTEPREERVAEALGKGRSGKVLH